MSRYNIFKVLRDILREAKTFGDPEFAQLRKEAQTLKQQLEQLKQLKADSRKKEEALALGELRKAVAALQLMDNTLQDQEKQVATMLEKFEADMHEHFDKQIEEKTQHMLAALTDEALKAEFEHLEGAHSEPPPPPLPAGRAQPGVPSNKKEGDQHTVV